MIELDKFCDIAQKAAIKGGQVLQKVAREKIIDNTGRDVKHQADLESENAIVNYLKKASDYPVLSEEEGRHDEVPRDGYFWLVDPLDGTLNFSQGIKFACVSIALWHRDDPVLGTIYDFNHEELFGGIVGQTASCNDSIIFPSSVNDPSKAVLATGFPVNRDFSSAAIDSFLKRIQIYKKIRLLGSAGLSLAYVACGRCDAYFEEDIMIWDVAAGIALVKAAGGFVTYRFNQKNKFSLTVQAGLAFKKTKGDSRDTL
jgi:myo-inositol-1(or 4)-monophosphatase